MRRGAQSQVSVTLVDPRGHALEQVEAHLAAPLQNLAQGVVNGLVDGAEVDGNSSDDAQASLRSIDDLLERVDGRDL